MPAIDYKKELKQLYAPSAKEVVLVDVPPLHFLMIDGLGDPRKTAPEKLRTVIRQPFVCALPIVVRRLAAGNRESAAGSMRCYCRLLTAWRSGCTRRVARLCAASCLHYRPSQCQTPAA
jgi:hypothetical protein